MTKLITETPDHPIPFLIDHLQTKQGSPGKLTELCLDPLLCGRRALQKANPLAGTAAAATRSRGRSIQRNPKSPRVTSPCPASPPPPPSPSPITHIVRVCVWCVVPRSIECPSWDWRESRDFDELNHILQESKKLGKALESLSRSIAISDELDQNVGGYNSGVRPRVVGQWVGREEEDADPLASEMLKPPLPREKTEACWSRESSPKARLSSTDTWERSTPHNPLSSYKTSFFNQISSVTIPLFLSALLSDVQLQDSFDSLPPPPGAEEDMEDEDEAMELLDLLHLQLFLKVCFSTNGARPEVTSLSSQIEVTSRSSQISAVLWRITRLSFCSFASNMSPN
ncbi:hypothetical protein KUCAC02_034319 [Chaenocephalus aceratus]|nr:hypothetical protein KUCAC02_034319 [Chaenocephalus aceratus]